MSHDLQRLFRRLLLAAWFSHSAGKQLRHRPSTATGAVIFFHGFGCKGDGCVGHLDKLSGFEFVKRLEEAGVMLVAPEAPMHSVPIHLGSIAHAWFDLPKLPVTLEAEERTESASESFDQIVAPILSELNATVGLEKVVIGGYSMGAEFALQMLNFAPKNIAGIFCMSGYLKDDSGVWEALETGNSFPPVWMGHGTVDDSVAFENGKATYDRLLTKGITAQFHPVEDMSHDMSKEELSDVVTWSLQQLGIDEESSS
mmetsp:Transcript_27044/g.59364  ORF Transcript_27044/g.59364 Transcript_27044/m.59364 type:complete len:256 (-) Transcript_27044:94-861(-)